MGRVPMQTQVTRPASRLMQAMTMAVAGSQRTANWSWHRQELLMAGGECSRWLLDRGVNELVIKVGIDTFSLVH